MAAAFVQKTGIDALAVSIGNAHGIYTKLPHLDFERLAKLKAATRIPLVLHGGSGTPEADLRRAISLGIAKVNVATELISCRAAIAARAVEHGKESLDAHRAGGGDGSHGQGRREMVSLDRCGGPRLAQGLYNSKEKCS